MTTSRAATSSLFILFFCAFGIVLSSPEWSLYKGSQSESGDYVYDNALTPEDNTSASLLSLVDVYGLVRKYGNVEEPKTGEILLLKNFQVTSSSTVTAAAKKKSKGKGGSKGAKGASSVGISAEIIQNHLSNLSEDYTAAYFVKNLPNFVEKYFNRLFQNVFKSSSEDENQIPDSSLFENVQAIKISFIENNKFVIYNYFDIDLDEFDPFNENLLDFSTKLSSFSLSAVSDLVIKSHQGFVSLIEILKKRKNNGATPAKISESKGTELKSRDKKKGPAVTQTTPNVTKAEAEKALAILLAEEEAVLEQKKKNEAAKLKNKEDQKLNAKKQQQQAEQFKKEEKEAKIKASEDQSKRDKERRQTELEAKLVEKAKLAHEHNSKITKEREEKLAKEREEKAKADQLAKEAAILAEQNAKALNLAKEAALKEALNVKNLALAKEKENELKIKEQAKAAMLAENARLAEERTANLNQQNTIRLALENKQIELAKKKEEQEKLAQAAIQNKMLQAERKKALDLERANRQRRKDNAFAQEQESKAARAQKERDEILELYKTQAEEANKKAELLAQQVQKLTAEKNAQQNAKRSGSGTSSSNSSISSFGASPVDSPAVKDAESRNSPLNLNAPNVAGSSALPLNLCNSKITEDNYYGPSSTFSSQSQFNSQSGSEVPQSTGYSLFASSPIEHFDHTIYRGPASKLSLSDTPNSLRFQNSQNQIPISNQFSPASRSRSIFPVESNEKAANPFGKMSYNEGNNLRNYGSPTGLYPATNDMQIGNSFYGTGPSSLSSQGTNQSQYMPEVPVPESNNFSLFSPDSPLFGPSILEVSDSKQSSLEANSFGLGPQNPISAPVFNKPVNSNEDPSESDFIQNFLNNLVDQDD